MTREKGAVRRFNSLELRTSNSSRSRSAQSENTPVGCSKRPPSKATGESKPEAYPQGYVEDFEEPRTTLADFFSILLQLFLLFFSLLLFDQAGEVGALELEAVCGFGLVPFCFLDGSLDDVTAMFSHRLMIRE